MESTLQRLIYFNPSAQHWKSDLATTESDPRSFHKQLPKYHPTSLISLDKTAKDIGVKAVHLKYEGDRLDLPSFKILGASWGAFRAITHKCNLPLDSNIETVGEAACAAGLKLVTATDGNHGRAVAYMASVFGIPAEVFVPSWLQSSTVGLIRGEGAAVTVVAGSYDLAVEVAASVVEKSKDSSHILVQDTGFAGYEEIPKWIVEGYSTMLKEIDDELGQAGVDLVIAPVGVGSFAQAVVSHYKSPGHKTRVLTVEPETAPCLYTSLKNGQVTVLEKTGPTIMAGMNCGTVSSIAWPILQAGVDGSITVSECEAHEAVQLLEEFGVEAGPCGAATLSALRRLALSDRETFGLNGSSVVVLLCTEGRRPYQIPVA